MDLCSALARHIARADPSQDHSRALQAAINRLPTDWRRRRGRPRRTWLRTIESDLQRTNLGLNSAWLRAQDRSKWRSVVETAMLTAGCATWWWWWYSKWIRRHTTSVVDNGKKFLLTSSRSCNLFTTADGICGVITVELHWQQLLSEHSRKRGCSNIWNLFYWKPEWQGQWRV